MHREFERAVQAERRRARQSIAVKVYERGARCTNADTQTRRHALRYATSHTPLTEFANPPENASAHVRDIPLSRQPLLKSAAEKNAYDAAGSYSAWFSFSNPFQESVSSSATAASLVSHSCFTNSGPRISDDTGVTGIMWIPFLYWVSVPK